MAHGNCRDRAGARLRGASRAGRSRRRRRGRGRQLGLRFGPLRRNRPAARPDPRRCRLSPNGVVALGGIYSLLGLRRPQLLHRAKRLRRRLQLQPSSREGDCVRGYDCTMAAVLWTRGNRLGPSHRRARDVRFLGQYDLHLFVGLHRCAKRWYVRMQRGRDRGRQQQRKRAMRFRDIGNVWRGQLPGHLLLPARHLRLFRRLYNDHRVSGVSSLPNRRARTGTGIPQPGGPVRNVRASPLISDCTEALTRLKSGDGCGDLRRCSGARIGDTPGIISTPASWAIRRGAGRRLPNLTCQLD
jgi:hypothetical protein